MATFQNGFQNCFKALKPEAVQNDLTRMVPFNQSHFLPEANFKNELICQKSSPELQLLFLNSHYYYLLFAEEYIFIQSKLAIFEVGFFCSSFRGYK